MLYYAGLLFLVVAVSLDGFGVGVTYGMQKIRMPLLPLFIIMCCSGIVVLLSMTIGSIMTEFISANIASKIGATILIGIGLFSFMNIHKQNKKKHKLNDDTQKQNPLRTVIETPNQADLDQSGSISPKEGLLLGIALALDAFGAGIGAAIIGYTPFMTASLVALMSGTFVYCGMQIGLLLIKNVHLRKLGFLPPILLIMLGIFNMF